MQLYSTFQNSNRLKTILVISLLGYFLMNSSCSKPGKKEHPLNYKSLDYSSSRFNNKECEDVEDIFALVPDSFYHQDTLTALKADIVFRVINLKTQRNYFYNLEFLFPYHVDYDKEDFTFLTPVARVKCKKESTKFDMTASFYSYNLQRKYNKRLAVKFLVGDKFPEKQEISDEEFILGAGFYSNDDDIIMEKGLSNCFTSLRFDLDLFTKTIDNNNIVPVLNFLPDDIDAGASSSIKSIFQCLGSKNITNSIHQEYYDSQLYSETEVVTYIKTPSSSSTPNPSLNLIEEADIFAPKNK